MNLVQERIYKINPAYLKDFDELVKVHSQFGGGGTDEKFSRGKSFSNAYEFYIYAFFIGLYRDEKKEILDDDNTKTFWEIENWKPRELTDYLIVCAIAESDFDMIMLEQMGEEDIKVQIKLLKNTIEGFANAGLSYINNKLNKEPDLIDDDMFFINLLSDDY